MSETTNPGGDPTAGALARVRAEGGVILLRAPADGAVTDYLRAQRADAYAAAQPAGFGPEWTPWGALVATLARRQVPTGWLDEEHISRPLSALGPRTAAALHHAELPADSVTPAVMAAAIVGFLEISPASLAIDRLERAPARALEVLETVIVELPPGAALLLACADGPVADRLEPAIRASGGTVLYATGDDPGESLRAVERRIAALDLEPARSLATWALDRIAAGGDRRAEAVACARLATALRDAGAPPSVWEPIVRRGLRLVPEVRDERIAARLALLVVRYERIPGSVPASVRLGRDPHLLAVIERLGDRSLAIAALDGFAYRDRDASIALAASAAEADDPGDRYRILDIAGRCLLYHHGDHAAAEPVFVAAELEGERAGLPWARAGAIFQQATCRLMRGDLDDAIAMSEVARGTIERLGLGHRVRGASSVGFAGSIAYLRGGNWRELRSAATVVLGAEGAERTTLSTMAAAYDAIFAVRTGEPEQARAGVRGVLVVANALGPRGYTIPGLVSLAGIAAVELVDRPLAEFADAVLEGAQGVNAPDYVFTTVAITRARIRGLGDPVTGAEALESAAGAAEERGLRAAAAHARTSAALLYASVGDGRGAPLAALVAPDLAAMGMTPWLLGLRELLTDRSFGAPVLPSGLSPREAEVIGLVATGATTAEIARELVLSAHTVNRHIANAYTKIGARNRADATAFALRAGLVEQPSA